MLISKLYFIIITKSFSSAHEAVEGNGNSRESDARRKRQLITRPCVDETSFNNFNLHEKLVDEDEDDDDNEEHVDVLKMKMRIGQ